jgi:hypothetical protein
MEEAVGGIQDKFAALGLTSPVSRGVVGASLGYVVVEAIRPGISYKEDGSHRPWIVTDPKAKDGTSVPWFIYPAVSGALMALFL